MPSIDVRLSKVEQWQKSHDALCLRNHTREMASLKWQNISRLVYFVLTMSAIFANGFPHGKDIFEAISGVFQ